MRCFWLSLFLLFGQIVNAVEIDTLRNALNQRPYSFGYPLAIKVMQGTHSNEDVILCCPGYGGDSSLAEIIKSNQCTSQHLVSFNFPDYNILNTGFNSSKTVFGGIEELLPALYVLKRIVIDAEVPKVSLYGFSAGGGAVVNLIGVLNGNTYDQHLLNVGIDSENKSKILSALETGVILLDAPLKSIEEIIETKGTDPQLGYLTRRYAQNNMRPIDALNKWQGLNLSVVLFFQTNDEALSNRDDQLFAQRLRQVNAKGENSVINADEGGHCGFHSSLWNAFRNIK